MEKNQSNQPSTGSATVIFIVDDNAMLVEYAAAVLKAAGYALRTFTDPVEVLPALRAANPKAAVLVTDYDMGTMNGLDLIVAAHEIQPSLKTILLSGTIDGSFISSHAAKVDGFLGKPYRPAQLTDLISDVLHGETTLNEKSQS